jgi:2-oxoisovalerate dehydrogenase E1 component alpha subunit
VISPSPPTATLGAAVALGVDLVGYLASHLGICHGGHPTASAFAPFSAVVGGPVTHAVGWAMGARLDDTGGVAITYFGDGASSQGDVHEAMNFAAVYRLPVVFFCQNNGWTISVSTERQVAGGSVAARAAGYGIAGRRVDGNDDHCAPGAAHGGGEAVGVDRLEPA